MAVVVEVRVFVVLGVGADVSEGVAVGVGVEVSVGVLVAVTVTVEVTVSVDVLVGGLPARGSRNRYRSLCQSRWQRCRRPS